MAGKRLYLFVEGPSDERLFFELIKPAFEKQLSGQGGSVVITQYAHTPKQVMNALLTSILAQGNEYLLFADKDSATCITAKKQELQKKFASLDPDRVIIVIRVIEGWYFAGLDATNAKRLKVKHPPRRTEKLTKPDFKAVIPSNFKSGTDFMIELLKSFEIATAKQQNTSFRYLFEKYQLDP